jgi:hypothetical protein
MDTLADPTLSGGCLCGALRYEFSGPVLYAGLCHCVDCQKSTGSAFAPYMGVHSKDVALTGAFATYNHPLSSGRVSRRNFCPACGSTVFGGDPSCGTLTLYAGTLDDSSRFTPLNQIFTCVRRAWAHVPLGTLPEFEQLP